MNLKTFFENFELMAEAPNGVQKLREMVLQLAVQGKLVPQDPNDEPASVLLEKIIDERKKQVIKGRKQKPFTPNKIENDEIGFNIPKLWSATRLGTIVSLDYGKGLPKTVPKGSSKIPAYGANGIKKYTNAALTKEKIIIVGRKGSAGAVNKVYEPCWPLDVTYYIKPSNFLYFEFLFNLLKSLSLESFAKGIKPGLNRNDVYGLVVGLPPLAEQKRIVAKVDELMALCDELEARKQKASQGCIRLNDSSIDKLLTAPEPKKFNKHWQRICSNFDLLYRKPENVAKLRQAILQLAVQGKLVPQDPKDKPASVLLEKIQAEKERLVKDGKIRKTKPLPPINPDEIQYALPVGWEWAKLGNLGITQTGTTPSKSKSEYFGDDISFIKPADISDNSVNYDNEKLSFLGLSNGRLIKANSILMVCIGGSIGKVNYINRDCSCNQQINTITPIGVSHILLNYFMRASSFQDQVISRAPKTTLPILSKGKWEQIPMPIPPLKEQKRIVAKVDELMTLCDDLEDGLLSSQTESGRLIEAAVVEVLAA